jgi:DNA primase
MTTDEMVELLEKLDMEPKEVQGKEVKAKCPAHFERTGKEDKNPSFSINASTGAFRCWSCNFRGNLQFLVAYIGNVALEDVESYLLSKDDYLSKQLSKIGEELKSDAPPVVLHESELALYIEPPTDALASRGLTKESARKYGLLFDKKRLTWIIPIRDPATNALWGWQEKGYKGRYFMNFPEGIKKGRALFGYYQSRDCKDIVVVESPLDVVRLDSVGVKGGVAVYGAMLTKEQLALLDTKQNMYLALDNDEAGMRSSQDVLKWANGLNKELWFFNYSNTDMKDVGGMSKAEIYEGITTARISLRKGAFSQ